ncbi:RNA polymerase factor sigma-54 [Zooshikella harenae]|uniref:RNA polymerase sigma-54 factor n=1 Tax=Zooshikella harenae TaxID=2827238 RepID=A0ABS5Z7P8_9GAMM|nr:RNA polymerase factor sigma-54 [Zooshikella harenae]MBU2710076.1 RNA polymerase factor sigma-54 [Zooshikella harenae]
MKPSLVLKMGQQLTMTPQLQQAIKLLQLSTLDLQQEIQQALDSNPLLELIEDASDTSVSGETAESTDEQQVDITEETSPSSNGDGSSIEATNSPSQEQDSDSSESVYEDQWAEQIPSELSVDTAWDDVYEPILPTTGSSSSNSDEEFDYTARNSTAETIQTHLHWQLNLTPLSDNDRLIAIAIIDAVDESGYLTCTLEDIQESFDPELEIELDEVVAVHRLLKQFDPVGVAARDLKECLFTQLTQLSANTPFLEEAKLITQKYLHLLGNHDYNQLMRKAKLKEEQLKQAILLIQSLNPRPGSVIQDENSEYIVPDVIVQKRNDRWSVELNSDATPRLRINASYASLVKRADSSSDNTYIKNHLQEARWFIKSLQSRNETLMRVASCIVEHQKGFLEYGEEAMKPLVLHDIAEAVGMHESTISRVTTQKYMHTPRGIFELKYFFSSHVSTSSGGECSSTAIRAIIKKLIAVENARKPLSDSKIAKLLEEQGIKVARRTIAKYRESLSIPPSNERKRLV